MEFFAPTTLDEAYRALMANEARCLAGGQSLIAMMNLGLVSPSRLVSLRNIESLRGITRRPDGGIRIGAMTTHSELAALDIAEATVRLLASAARVVAYPAVRMQGTVGGSVAHADPAADYPVALTAAEAEIEIGSPQGSRTVPAHDFFRGMFETALRQGEIIVAVVLPPGARGAGAAYEKLSVVAGDFAIASVAAIVGETANIAIGGCGPKPLSAHGLSVREDALLVAGKEIAETCDPPDDQRASAAYRRKVIPALICRAVRAAQASIRAPQ